MGFYTYRGVRKHASTGRIVSGEPVRYYLNDREVSAEEYDLAFPSKPLGDGGESLPGHQSACWPQPMESLAVHPSQVAAANARAKLHGIDAVYDRTGVVHVGSRRDRAKLIRLEGARDKSGGYSDG